jgi:hypothetical protein
MRTKLYHSTPDHRVFACAVLTFACIAAWAFVAAPSVSAQLAQEPGAQKVEEPPRVTVRGRVVYRRHDRVGISHAAA